MKRQRNQGRAPDPSALKDRALAAAAEGITIADARLPGMPLIYVNSGFERLTGYSADSVLGKNCRFLQGPGTDPAAGEEIRRAIAEERESLVEILNYRKDGTSFWNRLSITPVRDGSNRVTHYIGVQSDITLQKNIEEALRQAKKELEAVNQRMKMELDMAAGIQKSLLPANNQSFEGVEFCWQFLPCVELAGDTLDIIPLDEYRTAFYVIDVSGHGVSSALLSVTLHRWLSYKPGTFQVPALESGGSICSETDSPAAVARQLNHQFPMTGETPQYFTMLYGVLDRRNGDFRYVSAGHPGPILVSKSGDAVRLQSEGFPIGLLPDADYHNEQMQLQPGDRLYLFSDGIPEAANAEGKEFGAEKCRSSLSRGRDSSLQESLVGLMADLGQWCQNVPFHDDITVLGVEYHPSGVAP